MIVRSINAINQFNIILYRKCLIFVHRKPPSMNDTFSSHIGYGRCLLKIFREYAKGDINRIFYDNVPEHMGIQGAFYSYEGLKNEKHPNGGLKLPGFDTFTDEQMFSLSYAQTKGSAFAEKEGKFSSAAKYKVLGHLSNSLAFSAAFNCGINTPMNRERKCDPRIERYIFKHDPNV